MSHSTDLRKPLSEARDALAEGLESVDDNCHDFEPEWSKEDRDLISRIDAALAEPVEPVALPFAILDEEMAALRRFHETAGDEGTYDVPKSMMSRLADIGLLRHISQGIYEETTFGMSVLNGDFAAPASQWRRVEDGLPPNWKIKVTGPDSDGLLWLTISNTSGRHLSFSAASGDGLLRGAILTELMRDLSALPEADK